MAAPVPPPRPLVFVWENIGPTHADRLLAMAERVGPDSITAVQFSAQSNTYDWTPDALPIRTVTLSPRPSRGRKADLAWPLIRACWRAGRHADIFLCHYTELPVAVAAFIMRLGGRRVYAMVESKFDDYPRKLRHDVVKSMLFWPYHGAIVASRRAREYMAYLGIPRNRIVLGYSTLSVERIAALSGEPMAPDGTAFSERDFAIVARLVPKKNLGVALQAFALWLERTERPRSLHLLGGGPLEDDLRSQAERLGIAEHVHFHGFLQTREVSRYLGRSLCLLLTSVEEQFGLVVIEAQAVGLPVLVTINAGAVDELVENGVNGYAIDPGNPRSLAALMLQLSEDEATWRRFAEAARSSRFRGDARHFATAVATISARGSPGVESSDDVSPSVETA